MTRPAALVVLLALCLSQANATVTPLPGVTPQTTTAGSSYAQRIAVRVTTADGQPAANVRVWWRHFDLAPSSFGGSGCTRSVTLMYCHADTNPDGVADLGAAHSWWASTERVEVTAAGGLGSAVIELTALPIAQPASMEVIAGDGQRAALGTRYANPIEVRVVRADGTPARGERVFFGFAAERQPRASFEPVAPAPSLTDGNGVARSPFLLAVEGVGPLVGVATYADGAAKATVSARFTVTNTTADGRERISYQDMWWSGPRENGWGMAIAQMDHALFSVLFAYNDAGAPTWWVIPEGVWDSGMGSLFMGRLYETRGAPYFAYDASAFRIDVKATLATLDFRRSERAGVLRLQDAWDPNRTQVDFSKDLVRMDFSMDAPMTLTGVGGLWWGGPSQNGWGLTIMEQPGQLFVVWLTYGADGKPTWFVMPSGRWEGTAWTGEIYRARGSPWFDKAYDASRFGLTQAGRYRIEFDSTERATFRWSVGEHSGAVPIVKQDFGP